MGDSVKRTTILLLSAWILVLQAAVSSPQLHAFLHGHVAHAQSCGEHGSSNDPCEGETGPSHPSHHCGVVLLASGLITEVPFEFTPAEAEQISSLDWELPGSPIKPSRYAVRARAPPVL